MQGFYLKFLLIIILSFITPLLYAQQSLLPTRLLACEHKPQTMSRTPGTIPWINRGKTAAYRVSIKNNDSLECPATQFFITTSNPTDLLKTSLTTQWITLNPGVIKQFDVFVTSSPNISAGVYSIGITTHNINTPGIEVSVIANVGINPF